LVCSSIMFGGTTISLILPKLIRSVVRDDIWTFSSWAGNSARPTFLFQRHKASAPRSTARLPKTASGLLLFVIYQNFRPQIFGSRRRPSGRRRPI
jgi:hypothetical protein